LFYVLYLCIWEENEYIKQKKKFWNQEEIGQEIIIIKIKKNAVKNEWKDIMKKLTKATFIEKAKLIHRNKYDYSYVNYINNSIKVYINCAKHGIFYQKPNDHLMGRGCRKCYDEERTLTTESFIKKARELRGEKYNYENVKYISSRKKVKIICPLHGEFLQSPNQHLSNGNGCSKCGYEKTSKTLSSNINDFVIKAIKIHGNRYDYSLAKYVNANTKIKIICHKHGSFLQKPLSHLNFSGCPKCKHTISKPEIEFLNYLKIPDTKENRQVEILKKKVDGFDEKTNTIYEFLGDYWHGNPTKFDKTSIHPKRGNTFGELYQNTFKRLNILKENGYKVNYIWEDDWKKFKKEKIAEPNIYFL